MTYNFDNWCPEIYKGLFVNRHSEDRISVAPCCQANSKMFEVGTFDFETNVYLSQLRQDFAKGSRPNACIRCWEVEDKAKKSRRQSVIEFYNTSPCDKIKIQSLDFRTTWACNSACIMCGPENSSLWATELDVNNKLLGKSKIRQNPILDRLKLSDLKKVHFNGGEPRLTDDHLNVLKSVSLDSLFASYNTNGTIYPNKQTLDIWKQMSLVKLFFSIDATGAAFNYIRWPGQWNQVEDNLKRMRDTLPSNLMFGFNVTVGAYNVFELPDVVDWFRTNLSSNRDGDPSDFNIQIAYNFDPAALQDKIKQQAMLSIRGYKELQVVYNYLNNNKYKNINWESTLDRIDRRRKTDWHSSLKIGKML